MFYNDAYKCALAVVRSENVLRTWLLRFEFVLYLCIDVITIGINSILFGIPEHDSVFKQ